MKVGSTVLALRDNDDGLWHLAKVTAYDETNIAVVWCDTQTESAVERQSILPINSIYGKYFNCQPILLVLYRI
jgi:hypothetical protein